MNEWVGVYPDSISCLGAGVVSMAGYLPLPALRLLHAATCLQVHRSFTALADMGDDLAVSQHCQRFVND